MIDGGPTLTLRLLKEFGHHKLLDTGICEGGPAGLNVYSAPGLMRWVVVTGGNNDWAVYVAGAKNDPWHVARMGDKVTDINKVKKVVPCDEEAAARYRR